MTDNDARAIARAFINRIGTGAWTIRDLEAVMPSGYDISGNLTDGDVFPITIGHVAHVIRTNSFRS